MKTCKNCGKEKPFSDFYKDARTSTGCYGSCKECYSLKRYGVISNTTKIGTTDIERFWTYIIKTETCWLWTGHQTYGGYSQFQVEGRQMYVHRYSYVIHKGPIPDGLQIDHLCRVKTCVNPEHLEAVTQKENIQREWKARKAKQLIL